MLIVQSYFPGQKATIFLETLDSVSGERADGYSLPVITRIIFPDLSLAQGFPQDMVKLDVGLYLFQFTIPLTASAVGSYLVDGYYYQLPTNLSLPFAYQMIVNAPFGNFGTIPVG